MVHSTMYTDSELVTRAQELELDEMIGFADPSSAALVLFFSLQLSTFESLCEEQGLRFPPVMMDRRRSACRRRRRCARCTASPWR